MKLLSIKEVTKIINRSETTLYRWWKIKGFFPKPIIYNGRAVAWTEEAVQQWIKSNSNIN
jgi:predicted DNA-binding transcriptional regulator AlpA